MNIRIILNRILLIFGILLLSCSPRVTHNVLDFFFDGVPDIVDPEVNEKPLLASAKDTANGPVDQTVATKPEFNYHPPYLTKDCKSCHDQNSVGDLIKPEPDLCYTCHKDFNDTYEFIHGPVEIGHCNTCHNPHLSRHESLLLRDGDDLCLYCHQPHPTEEIQLCIICHNPHGGDNISLLRQ